MAKNELVNSGAVEVVARANAPLPVTEGFYVFRRPYSPRKVAKATKKVVKVAKVAQRGRPRVYNGTDRRIIAAALKRYGITKGMVFLAKERKLKVSLTTARSVAEEFKLTFKRGRPAA